MKRVKIYVDSNFHSSYFLRSAIQIEHGSSGLHKKGFFVFQPFQQP